VKDVLRVFWEALKDFWDELFLLMLMNIVTVLLFVPVVTCPPALAGLWNVANLVAGGRAIHWRDYFEGFRRYFWKVWGLALLNILVTVIVLTNVRFYTPGIAPFEISPTSSSWMGGFFLAAGFSWLVFQMYPLALWFLITLALFAVVCNKAVLHLLEPFRERAQVEGETKESRRARQVDRRIC
jgi:hypothetical protein